LFKSLCAIKGVSLAEEPDEGTISFKAYKEKQYDKLADHLRTNIDIKTIYQILEEGV
jgi:adenosylcobyric acid synthase